MPVTVGDNSYVTVAEADAYFADSINSAGWDGADAPTKDKALISATRYLDRQRWQGTKTVSTQNLEWPRSGVTCNGDPVDSDEVPDEIKESQYEMAQILIQDPTSGNNLNTGSNTKRAKAGSAEVEFFRPTSGTIMPDIVHQISSCLLGGSVPDSSGVGPGGYSSGGCDGSSFDTDYDRTRGFG